MKSVYVPNYYPAFRCIASACRHSCCVGWEIDVDDDALARFDRVEGALGDRLRAGIDREADPPCFILSEGERCPFLNQSGLCDLITELGEESLCHICADHPRFRNVLYDRVELGLGLCCEAAAALILGQTEPLTVILLPEAEAARERTAHTPADKPDPVTDALLDARETLLTILRDRTRPLSDRIRHLLTTVDIDLSMILPESYTPVAALLRDMERLDPAWDACLDALAALPEAPADELTREDLPPWKSLAGEHLVGYFLYRYMTAEDDERFDLVAVRLLLAILSAALILAIHRATGGTDFASLCEVARMYSSEIEYSEENLERLTDEIEDILLN